MTVEDKETLTEAPRKETDTAPLRLPESMRDDSDLPKIGLDSEAQIGIVSILTPLLADEVLFYTLLRKYHWNVTGPQFYSLHAAFEEQYTVMADLIDEIAERIRQYGAMSIGTLTEFSERSRFEEQPGVNPNARQMVIDIMERHEELIRYLREDIDKGCPTVVARPESEHT
ncbi:MAG: ferritin-like domain-containing protein, partial [Aggregatilineales bacterium]